MKSRKIKNVKNKTTRKGGMKRVIFEKLGEELGDPVKIADKLKMIKDFYDIEKEKDILTQKENERKRRIQNMNRRPTTFAAAEISSSSDDEDTPPKLIVEKMKSIRLQTPSKTYRSPSKSIRTPSLMKSPSKMGSPSRRLFSPSSTGKKGLYTASTTPDVLENLLSLKRSPKQTGITPSPSKINVKTKMRSLRKRSQENKEDDLLRESYTDIQKVLDFPKNEE